MKSLSTVLCFAVTLLLTPSVRCETFESDICVFGATSGGAVAAVQAGRMGKKVILAEPGNHVGGMTSGGLGWVDFGRKETIGGISKEFSDRIAAHYHGRPDAAAQGEGWTFEPHVAEAILNTMLVEAKAPVHFGQRLAGVKMKGPRIGELVMENGNIFRAKMFIDATYEGDLMAKAKVSYIVGREGNGQYGETLNGVRINQPRYGRVDPYVRPGDPTSGLIPLVQNERLGNPGDPSPVVQAYNYRLCLTRNPGNRLPLAPPPDYDPARFELIGRHIQAAVDVGAKIVLNSAHLAGTNTLGLIKIDPLPNQKTDTNNGIGVSTDYVGYSAPYPEADYAARERIAKDHENYMRGYFHFIATDPRVPENIREEIKSYGLCRDEFKDTGGWPFQLYVREARRMIGRYVMTEKDCTRERSFDDSIGLGSYPIDSHLCRRLVHDGSVIGEGGFYKRLNAGYPISYRSLTPKEEECENLLVPACCSASHVAYASVRMEPVFMILGQSSATAAALAIDQNASVQRVDVKKLQERLSADGQKLETSEPTGEASPKP